MSVSAAQAEAFYGEVLAAQAVWGVRDSRGCPAPMTPDGYRAMPFWSALSRAESITAHVAAYRGFQPFEIGLNEWQERWLPDLDKAGLRVGLNWSGKRAQGYDLTVADLLRNLAARNASSVE